MGIIIINFFSTFGRMCCLKVSTIKAIAESMQQYQLYGEAYILLCMCQPRVITRVIILSVHGSKKGTEEPRFAT